MAKTSSTKKQPRRLGSTGKVAAVIGAIGAAGAVTVAARRVRASKKTSSAS